MDSSCVGPLHCLYSHSRKSFYAGPPACLGRRQAPRPPLVQAEASEEEIPQQQRHYSTAAAKKRNFLIHAYYNIDAGTPFESEREFQELIKSPLAEAIYACAKASGLQDMDHELLVEDFAYNLPAAESGLTKASASSKA
jgi:hypothetical protein